MDKFRGSGLSFLDDASTIDYDGSDTQVSRSYRGRKRGEPTIITSDESDESLTETTVPPSRSTPDPILVVHQELNAISEKLKREMKSLTERQTALRLREGVVRGQEASVKEREAAFAARQRDVTTLVQHQLEARLQLAKQETQKEIDELQESLKEKTKENRRLMESFLTLKKANDVLKKEMDELQGKHGRLERQSTSLQARLLNLQRRNDQTTSSVGSTASGGREKDTSTPISSARSAVSSLSCSTVSSRSDFSTVSRASTRASGVSLLEPLCVALEWAGSLSLKPPSFSAGGAGTTADYDVVADRCAKLLPCLADVLRDLAGQLSPPQSLNLVRFLYWALRHLQPQRSDKRAWLSNSLRRLGTEVYRTRPHTRTGQGPPGGPLDVSELAREPGQMLRSSRMEERVLSALVILAVQGQVDHMAHVFDLLKADLKTEGGRDLFLQYSAFPVLTPYLAPTSKGLVHAAVDTVLLLTVDSPSLHLVTAELASDDNLRVFSILLRHASETHPADAGCDERLLEKLSIVLQKVSKTKGIKRRFDSLGLTSLVQTLQKNATGNSFLQLNLRSVLFNLSPDRLPVDL